MSTYAVFGMTKQHALETARKSVSPMHKGDLLPEAEWLARVEKEADEIMAGSTVVRLSDKFDAPTFAKQFLEMARRRGGRSLHVKAFCKTGEISERTGKPLMHWIGVDMSDVA